MSALNITIGIALLCALGWLFTAVKWWAAEDRAKDADDYAAFLKAEYRERATTAQNLWEELAAVEADRDRLAAELARLTDRDAKGRFVRKEAK